MNKKIASLNVKAAKLMQQGNLSAAKTQLKKIIKAQPDSAESHFCLAQILQREGVLDSAKHHYEEVVRINPSQAYARFQLGNICYAQQAYEQALAFFKETWARDPNFIDALLNSGVTLSEMGRIDEALDAYHQALKIKPDDPLINYNMGEALLKQYRYPEASERYRAAIRLQPGFAAAHVSLGRCLQKLGRKKEALACHQNALQIDPGNWLAYHNSGICLFDDKALGSAEDAFHKTTELAPQHGLGYCYYGIILALQGKHSEAQQAWAQANTPIARHIVESYQYTKECPHPVRYFSTTSDILEYAVDQSRTEGLVLEFGVFFATSIRIIANKTNRTVHGFDSFEGLPESWDIGDTWGQKSVEKTGSYSTGGRIPETPDNVKLHVGTFEETLPGFIAEHKEDVSLINIDCDLYSSTATVFKYLADQITAGTVIVFDEYFCFSGWRDHEYKAFQEFLKESDLSYEYLAFSLFTGQAVVRIKYPV